MSRTCRDAGVDLCDGGEDLTDTTDDGLVDWEPEDPIFMNKIPSQLNGPLIALQSIKYDESNPEELANQYRQEGDYYFGKGKDNYKMAIESYDRALKICTNDENERAICLTNRALVNMELGNYGYAMDDCNKSIQLNPKNVKAYYIASKSGYNLERYGDSIRFLEDALLQESNNEVFALELQQCKKQLQIVKEKKKLLERQKKLNSKSLRIFIERLYCKGVCLGPYLMVQMSDYLASAGVDMMGCLEVFPVVFLYNQYCQMDLVRSFGWEDTFGMHLEAMFGGDTFPEWDLGREYVHGDLEMYVILNQVPAYKSKGKRGCPRKLKLNSLTNLGKLLTHGEYVIPGCPMVYVFPRGSASRREFLARHLQSGLDYLQ